MPGSSTTFLPFNSTRRRAGAILFPALLSWCAAAPACAAPLDATLTVTPSPVVTGGWVTVSLQVTNHSGGDQTNLEPAVDVNLGDVTAVGSPPAPVALLADTQTAVFDWTFSVNGAGTLAFTGTVTSDTDAASASGGATALVPAALESSFATAPTSLVGRWITGTLTVTNIGESDATGVLPVLYATPPGFEVIGWAVPAGPLTIPGLSSTRFVWTFSVSGGCGPQIEVGGALATDGVSGRLLLTQASATVLLKGDAWDLSDGVPAGAPLAAVSPTGESHGPHQLCPDDPADWLAFDLAAGRAYTIDSAGGAGDAMGELWADAGQSVLVGADDDGAGGLQFMIVATPGTTARHYLRVRTVPAGGTWTGSVRAREVLAGALALAPATPVAGQRLDAVFTVTNTGSAALTGTLPELQVNRGALAAFAMPVGSVTIGSGASAAFTWSWTVTAVGPVNLTATVTGMDAAIGRTVRATTGRGATAVAPVAPAHLDAAVAVLPGAPVMGQWISIVVTVTNTGGDDAMDVSPSLNVTSGAPQFDVPLVAGPTPAGSVTLSPGAAQAFTWTYSIGGAGYVNVNATVTGTDFWTGGGLYDNAYRSVYVEYPPTLPSGFTVQVPWEAGQAGQVRVLVQNPGFRTVRDVSVALAPASGATLVVLAAGPSPSGTVTLSPGSYQWFLWTFTAVGSGPVTFTATASGVDAASGQPLRSTSAATATIVAPATLSGVLTPPAGVKEGDRCRLTLQVTNAGENIAVPAAWVLAPADPGAFRIVVGPAVPYYSYLWPGSTITGTWELVALKSGTQPVTATLRATRYGTGMPVSGSASGVVLVEEKFANQAPLTAWPNPIAGGILTVAVKLEERADRVDLEMFNAAMQRVSQRTFSHVAPGGDAQLPMAIDGDWVDGIYLVRARVWFADGRRKVLDPVKIRVKR